MHNDSNSDKPTLWDVVVIGGGASGMMAAGTAAARGKKVLLLEKNPELGKKLLITGGGRCNVTNNKTDNRAMLAKYKGNDQFLFSTFSQWNVESTLSFFNSRGMETKEENEGRIFPLSNSAQSVYDVLHAYMKEGGVQVHKSSTVAGIARDKNIDAFSILTKSGNKIGAKKVILATGGTSRPETGSTGEGFLWLKKLKHTVIENDFALVPIALTDAWVKRISGLTIPDIRLTTYQTHEGKLVKQDAYKGKVLFTHVGISGPTVLNMSRDVGELLKYGDVVIGLDLFPAKDGGKLRTELQTILVSESNRKLKNVLSMLIPSSLVTPILRLAELDGDTFCHSVRTEDRLKLIETIKNIPLHVKGLLGKEKAVVSSGGVPLTEVDTKTMESRIVPGLFLIGDVLNIDRPSGGYSLQLCWTTGHVAGEHC
jgi:predicted Rossmann fold flavoprotein